WQRQIGFSAVHPAAVLGGAVLTRDQAGGLLMFDPQKARPLTDPEWLEGGRPATAALQEFHGSLWLLPHQDGHSALVVTVHDLECRLWKHGDGITAPLGPPQALEDRPAGAPALAGETVLLPLANGRLA